jgi:hypothetical protein
MPLDTEALAETDGSQAAQPESQTEMDTTDDPIIWGAEAIGRVINRNTRQVFHLGACADYHSSWLKAQTASGLTERNVALLRPIARFMWPLRP